MSVCHGNWIDMEKYISFHNSMQMLFFFFDLCTHCVLYTSLNHFIVAYICWLCDVCWMVSLLVMVTLKSLIYAYFFFFISFVLLRLQTFIGREGIVRQSLCFSSSSFSFRLHVKFEHSNFSKNALCLVQLTSMCKVNYRWVYRLLFCF